MPYVKPAFRTLGHPTAELIAFEGELNFVITDIINTWLTGHPSVEYRHYNAAIGVLECAKLELYRRMVAPYEDEKCAENGDVYGG